MEFKELLAAFAAKYGIDGLGDADGAAELDVDGFRVELLDDQQTHSLLACAEIGLPQPDADGAFCGLAEFYGFKDLLHKTCVGYRLAERCWGRGIATEAVALMVDYLFTRTDIEIITASTMIENGASARVLEKNGFIRTASGVPEDWGYEEPTVADKWFR